MSDVDLDGRFLYIRQIVETLFTEAAALAAASILLPLPLDFRVDSHFVGLLGKIGWSRSARSQDSIRALWAGDWPVRETIRVQQETIRALGDDPRALPCPLWVRLLFAHRPYQTLIAVFLDWEQLPHCLVFVLRSWVLYPGLPLR